MLNKYFFLVVLLTILFVLAMLFAQGWQFDDPLPPVLDFAKNTDRLNDIANYLYAMSSSIDQIISMLFNIQMGLFLLTGFTLQQSISKNMPLSFPLYIVLAFFSISSVAGFYFGYFARMQTIQIMDVAEVSFGIIQATINRQALFVSISAILAIAAVSLVILRVQQGAAGNTEKQIITHKVQTKIEVAGAVSYKSISIVCHAKAV